MFLRGRHCRSRPPQLLHNSGPLDFYRTHSGLGVLILNPTTLLAKTDFQLRSTRIIQDPFRLGSLPQIPHTLLECRDTDFQLRSTQSLQDPFRLGILNPQSSHVASLQRQIINSGPLDFYRIHSEAQIETIDSNQTTHRRISVQSCLLPLEIIRMWSSAAVVISSFQRMCKRP